MSITPRYWGSWKGLILKSIAIDGARTWSEIRASSGLDTKDLNQTFSELFSLNLLTKQGNSYWIRGYNLYKEYKDYGEEIQGSSFSDKFERTPSNWVEFLRDKKEDYEAYVKGNSHRLGNNVIGRLLLWTLKNSVDFNIAAEHFYLDGDFLDRVSKDIISFSTKRVVVINPYVDKCSLSDKLKDVCSSGREVLLITRSPESDKEDYGKVQKDKYHQVLNECGVQIFYNDYIHAKLLVVDDLIAILSSMNLYASSSGGKSWEAGLITWEEKTVSQVIRSIQMIQNSLETVNYG